MMTSRIAKFRVTFHHIANDLYVTVDVVSVSEDRAVEFARERFNLDQSWFRDGVKVLKELT